MTVRTLTAFILAVALVVSFAPRAVAGEPTVGVYYYPWYGPYPGGHRVTQSLRGHLDPAQVPAIGLYSNRSEATISSHIDQSNYGNIDFWAVSWWGPQSAEDVTFRTTILPHARAAELRYAIHYESTGRLGEFSNPDFSNLIPDFRFLANNYFQNPNYLQINGRPVVFMYVTRAYFNSQSARDAVGDLRLAMQSEFGIDPYIVGDDLFTGSVDLARARLWDAITDFDVYGTVLQANGSTSAALNQLESIYDNARDAIAGEGIAFIPTASPGFNDSGVRSGHPAAPRYLVDDPSAQEGKLFARMLSEVAAPRTDPNANNILMINSFNEWHEDTQIEPTNVSPRTNDDDSGSQRFTEGFFYEGYGDLYLDILRQSTLIERQGDYNGDGSVDAADYTVWRDTLGSHGVGLGADGDRDLDVDHGDYAIWQTNYAAPSGAGASGPGKFGEIRISNSHDALPEPRGLMLVAIAALVNCSILRTTTRLAARR